MKIQKIFGREVLDSRGVPTLECEIILEKDISVVATVPSGLSKGKYEAVELRDGDKKRFSGNGVRIAVENLEKKIAPILIGRNPDILSMDKDMIDLDGTDNKSNLGANTILAASIAIMKAQSLLEKKSLFKSISDLIGAKPKIPFVMFNILNGGLHGDNSLLFQEFMIMTKESSFMSALEKVFMVYQNLKRLLKEDGFCVGVGDEGGFAPLFKGKEKFPEETALDFLMKAINVSGLDGKIDICLDVAASQFYDSSSNKYKFHGLSLESSGLIDLYDKLIKSYPIVSIEDGISEEDWEGWELLSKKLASKVQLVGDDLFATNKKRINEGYAKNIANAVLIKPNQIGTVSETLDVIKFCKSINYETVVSHRSGETNDTFIADLAVGASSLYFKCGAPVRGERVAKYNRLLRIEKFLS